MASPHDQSESAHILPRPELNPLINPLLGENMGRWAEVYFTAAPEKREEAVLELLKELESRPPVPGGRTKPQPAAPPQTEHFPDPAVSSQIAAEDPALLTHCQTCGHDNPGSHQFCGMCGAKLSEEFLSRVVQEEGLRAQSALENRPFDCGSIGSNRNFHGAISRIERPSATSVDALDEHPGERSELPYLRRINENRFADNDTLNWNLEDAPSRPYRLYIGAVLAVVLFALLHMAWRSSQTNQSTSQVSPAPPVAASDASPQPVVESPPPATAPVPTPVPKADAPAAAGPPTQPTASSPVASSSGKTVPPSGEARSTAEHQQAGPAAASTFSGTGTEELAIAQGYLRGENGVQRNTSEAAQWLWKSVAKQNSEATLLLAELYLKGDGVSKNCDQARVLLDSAARKGLAGAGERLRHLPAFGCQ